MSIANKGSIYDKVINEDWYNTPDMGEYWNNAIYKKTADGQSSTNGKTEFFVENPPTDVPGYHEDLQIIAVKGNASEIYKKHLAPGTFNDKDNIYDGDTIKFQLLDLYDTNTPFQIYYDNKTIFSSVHHYLKETLQLSTDINTMSLRFIGINTPEIVHYVDSSRSSLTEDDIYTVKYSDLTSNNVDIKVKKKNGISTEKVNRKNIIYVPYKYDKASETCHERNSSDVITLQKIAGSESNKDTRYCEILSSEKKVDYISRRICFVSANPDKNLEYHQASIDCKKIVRDAFKDAEDVMFILDTASTNLKKSLLPEAYKKSFEKSTNNPFYSIYDMWKSAKNEKAAYKYSGYRYPGQEANGRFLAAVYIKKNGQWINLNKKVLYENKFAEKSDYSSSVDAAMNFHYGARGFKLWTYDKNNQLYIDSISDEVLKTKDDRKEIQKLIAGCELEDMVDHTVMIGDSLFMIPPTSIRAVSQTKTSKTHLIRAKGAMSKTLPKTERVIQMDLFFNGDEAINGIPIERTLPNGSKTTYMMNGLRGLLAQFKLTPFLPIHNTYINDVLNITAVSLCSYTISTMANYPRTLQVSLTMQEFEWVQYMPCQAVPENASANDLYRNGFSETIHFPLLRYYYQKAIKRGDELKTGSYSNIAPNHPDYIEKTLGNKTVLQPMSFKDPLIDFYIPDKGLLSMRKQAIIEMRTRPLGKKFNFNDQELKWIATANPLYEFFQAAITASSENILSMTSVQRPDKYDPFMLKRTNRVMTGSWGYQSIRDKKSPMIVYGKSSTSIKIKDEEVIQTHFVPAHTAILETYNDYRERLKDVVSQFDLVVDIEPVKNPAKRHRFSVQIVINLNDRFFDNSSSLDKIRQFCGKELSIEMEKIFNDKKIVVGFDSYFEEGTAAHTSLIEGFKLNNDNNPNMKALAYLAALTDSDGDGKQDSDMNKIIEDLKESMDLETAESIKFNRFEMGNPIITSISSSYNNIFANVSLKAIDGHAAQYTGGTDSSLEIVMIADDWTVGQLYYLNRLCVKNLIEYRKVIKSSPLRIDCDLTRMLGIHEVLIETMDIATIPDMPGRYNVSLKLGSIDRTIRNKEALKRIKGIDNANTQKDILINTKNYFDINKVLSQAELYPDLELPTFEELEKAGFYFMTTKYNQTRIFPDPDFYFIYWYPTLASSLRTSIIDIFDKPENFTYKINDDISDEVYNMQINIKDGNGKNPFTVLDWKEDDKYSSLVEQLTAKAQELYKNDTDKLLTKKEADSFTKSASNRIEKYEHSNKVISKMQEAIDNSVYNTFQVNTFTNVTVKDIDVLDTESDNDVKERDKITAALKNKILAYLKKPIDKGGISIKKDNPHLFFKPFSYPSGGKHYVDYAASHKDFADRTGKTIQDFAKTIVGRDDAKNFKFENHAVYVDQIIKAVAVGAMASESFFNADEKHIKKGYKETFDSTKELEEPLCYPPRFSAITNSKGQKENVPIYLYESTETSELLIAHDEETRARSIVFGRFGIRKYTGEELSSIFQGRVINKDGFLDPYVNPNLATAMFGKDAEKLTESAMDKRIKDYTFGITENLTYAKESTFRQMLVWLYILIDQDIFLNIAHYHAGKLIDVGEDADKFWDNAKIEELSKSIYDENEETYDAPTAWETFTSAVTFRNWRYKDEFNQLLGENVAENMDDAVEDQEKRIKEMLKKIQKNSEDYASSLVAGMFYTLGAITMSGIESSVYRSIVSGDLQTYSDSITRAVGSFSNDGMSEEQKKLSRYSQYLNYIFEEEERLKQNPIQSISYNNRVQRAYLKAANEPGVYMLHSMYDMVMNDKRGSMARAFPTYYMLLIDEGRQIGLWRLQDHFYDMNSIVEFEVVKSRKIAADTAKITMTNMYGTFNTDDSDQKDEFEYTMRDVWDSIFSPRPYFQKEYMRRKDSRDVNTTKMQPGARVHLRVGYGSDASALPIVFNGCVAEFDAGEVMTLVCQGDGVELANPHMFNPMDGKDIQNIKHTSEFFGLKQIMETWDNLSTPRDMLVLPLAAEGSWLQEQIRERSSGRFFNSNPFGIVHFGDRKYTSIFQTNGEVEQNIYESLSKPSWNYKECGMETIDDGLEKEYSVSEAPRVKVNLTSGTSYWDLMHIASSLSPDFICAVAPFQMRSTIFHGAPRYYYAYDYKNIDGKVVEKRKPFQQYHVFTSYSDIIDNRISTSTFDTRTNAVGHYVGPGWLSKTPKTVGPLFADIDIFPEFQRSTSVNLNFEYKNNDILPFNVPIVDKIQDAFDWTDGPNGEKTAWRATASALKNCLKDMYQGELIVMGYPAVKPFDKMMIADSYEDIGGSAEVEQVVHLFSVDNGYTTSITPDFITAIDNKWEMVGNGIFNKTIHGSLLATGVLIATNLNFHADNRSLYLGITRAAKYGQNAVGSMIDTALNVVGKSELQRDALLINNSIDSKLMKDILGISDEHIKFADKYREIVSVSSKFSGRAVTGPKSFFKVVEELERLGESFDALSPEKMDEFIEALGKIDNIDKTDAMKLLKEIDYNDAIKSVKAAAKLNADDITDIIKDLEKIDTDEARAAIKVLKNADGVPYKTLDLSGDVGKKFLSALKPVAGQVDDFSTAGLSSIAKIFTTKSDDIGKSMKIVSKIDDVGKAALMAKTGIKAVGGIVSFLVTLAVEMCLTKGLQNFLTNKLRNLQVLTMYPLKKDGMVWTAGLNGHQGSVVGSPAYDEPGWIESQAIKIFEVGGVGGFLRDMFITTDEMTEIVNGYKRGLGVNVEDAEDGSSPDKIRTEQTDAMLAKIAKSHSLGYVEYKNMYDEKRLKLSDITNRTEDAKRTYAFYKIGNIRDIEQTTIVADNLRYIFDKNDSAVSKLFDNNCMWFAADITKSTGTQKSSNGVILSKKNILNLHATDKSSREVYIKETSGKVKEFDIPYLRHDAMVVLNQMVEKIALAIQPDYDKEDCKFDKLLKNPIIIQSATLVNSTKGWRSTGFLFTIEVKNYDNLSNIIKEIEEQREKLAKNLNVSAPFTIKKEDDTQYGTHCYTVLAHCPTIF